MALDNTLFGTQIEHIKAIVAFDWEWLYEQHPACQQAEPWMISSALCRLHEKRGSSWLTLRTALWSTP
jgi:hypothetical protein